MKWLLLSAVLMTSLARGDEYRTFTNEEGQTIRARMVRVEGDLAVIQREDQKIFRFPIDGLSEDDQAYVRRWPVIQAVSNERDVKIRMRRLRMNRVVERANPDVADAVSYRGTREEFVYQIVFNNRSSQDLTDLTVEYRIFKDLAAHDIRHGTPAARPRRVTRSGTLTLKKAERRNETTLETEPFFLVETIVQVWGSYDRYTGRRRVIEITRKDELHGIWIRVMDGEQVVREELSSQNLPRRFSWD